MNSFLYLFRNLRNKIRTLKLPQRGGSADESLLSQEMALVDKKKSSSKHGTALWHLSHGEMTIFRLIGMAIVYIGYLMFQSLDLLYLIVSAWLISIAMESFIQVWQRRVPRWVSIGVSYIFFLLFLLTGIVIIIPFVLQQLSTTLTAVISYFYTMQSQINLLGLSGYVETLSWLPEFLRSYILSNLNGGTQDIQSVIVSNISSLVTTGSNYAKDIWSLAVTLLSWFFAFLWQIALLIMIAVFFSLEKSSVVSFCVSLFAGDEKKSHWARKIDLLYVKMWLWLKSQLWLCVYIAVIVYLVLRVLAFIGIDLPNKEALALMAWFTEFIPYIGPLLGGIPALIVGTSLYGLPGMFAVGLAYYIVQWIENNVLIPTLMNKSLGVSPLLIFLCVLLGGSVLWFMGIVLAVPLAVILTLLFDKDFQ